MDKQELSREHIMLLAQQWDINTEPVEQPEGWLFDCPGGKRLMHIASLSEAAFGFFLQKHLYNRGFARAVRFIPNKYGDPFALWEDSGIFFTDWFGGGNFALEREYDLWRLAALLGEFHAAAADLVIEEAPLQQLFSPLEYAAFLLEQQPPPMTEHMLPVYDKLCSVCLQRLERADDKNMRLLCLDAEEGHFAVQGRFNEQAVSEFYGELFITQFRDASYGVPLWELAYLLNRAFKLHGHSKGVLHGAIAEYEKFRPLSRAEKIMLPKLLALPLDFIYAIADWQEQRLNGDAFAEIMLYEEGLLRLRDNCL